MNWDANSPDSAQSRKIASLEIKRIARVRVRVRVAVNIMKVRYRECVTSPFPGFFPLWAESGELPRWSLYEIVYDIGILTLQKSLFLLSDCECLPFFSPANALMLGQPGPPLKCYLGYANACSHPPPPPFSISLVCKINTGRPFSFVIQAFSAGPLFSISLVCKVNTGRSFSLLRAGDFGNTHAVPPFPEWRGGGRAATEP